MSGEDIQSVVAEMITKHGFTPQDVFDELRKSHTVEEIRDIFERAPILRDHSKEIVPLQSDVEISDLLSEQREQILAERGIVSEQQEAARDATTFDVKMTLRRELQKAMNVTGGKEG